MGQACCAGTRVYVHSSIYEKFIAIADKKKEVYHWEEAAMKGQLDARFGLAQHEMINFRSDRAVKHLIIAANLGHDNSMQSSRSI